MLETKLGNCRRQDEAAYIKLEFFANKVFFFEKFNLDILMIYMTEFFAHS